MKRILVFLLLILIISCKKENVSPVCEIIQPVNNSTYVIGDSISITVEASDPDGLVQEIQLFFDGTGITSLTESPYYFLIGTNNYEAGDHLIEATAIDEYGKETSDELQISLKASQPKLTTIEVTAITDTIAFSGGEVLDDGGADIIVRGICWDTTSNPTLTNNFTSDGSGLGYFSSAINGLSCGTTYYVRAYATNSETTGYGNELTFTTPMCPVMPTVEIMEIFNIGEDTATVKVFINDDGEAPIDELGICWCTFQNPTIDDNTAAESYANGDSINFFLSELTPDTEYYIRPYSKNSKEIVYGAEESFITAKADITGKSGTLTDYDGNTYNWIGIGRQAWMAENLKTTHYADGTAIPLAEDSLVWNNLGIDDKAYCWYDNSIANRDSYGALYTWGAAMNGAEASSSSPSGVQGVCPEGWHLPSISEFSELLQITLGGLSIAGGKIKEIGTSHWLSPNTGATNEFRFTALPGGFRNYSSSSTSGNFLSIGKYGFWWSSTQYVSSPPIPIRAHYDNSSVTYENMSWQSGLSIRCVKD